MRPRDENKMSGHNKVEIDLSKPYQKNEIGVRGIVYFGLGLFLLIVVTFALMYIFQYEMLEPQAKIDDAAAAEPLGLKGDERLPPEPRLQSAPGFGVDSKDGRISLELREPQAEYKELVKQWTELWEKGETDPRTKTVISLSMDEAKERVLNEGNLKSVSEEAGAKAMRDASTIISASSAGRMATEDN